MKKKKQINLFKIIYNKWESFGKDNEFQTPVRKECYFATTKFNIKINENHIKKEAIEFLIKNKSYRITILDVIKIGEKVILL